ncbi:VPLPA-CTERM sorting domain-containing protein [Hwanghaeella grinnelliae]|uniref:VPLPA-CTERM sorting domain-containing protein n=1 Tax=Hwanghaeella grinnelliae TaxID=2500179 RepID=A0A3S2ZAT7_9PROT|nr:leishmanolysin-related zinc metalloendopeptidase [Hwanghaeella grinnelliae]RVU39473.1 VPLPA-CTERM sorting domain-containing protein [Hwanghaeella grinnelliae]
MPVPGKILALIAALFITVGTTSVRAAGFDISVVFGGGLTTSQQSVFSQAESFWESLITGYQPGITLSGITIQASGVPIDGNGQILGQAGPTSGVFQQGFGIATQGVMQFDTADLGVLETAGLLDEVIIHEMAHVMGFGTLWELNGLSAPGSGQYTGQNALDIYRLEFDPLATFIPVELDGGEGTADGHWDEGWAGTANELMTGFLNVPAFISATTVASFQDLGYTTIDLVVAVPLPASALLLLAGLGCLGGVRFTARRRNHRAAKHPSSVA